MEKTPEIDTNLYSRQIGTFGLETMGKLVQMRVLIVGLRGLGVECAKNLILAGPHSVDLHDPTTVAINDLGSNFYAREADVG
jgi:ubiquitin-activating enzyme E1